MMKFKPGVKLYRVTFEFEAYVAGLSPEDAEKTAMNNLCDISDNTPDDEISIIASEMPDPEGALKNFSANTLQELVYAADTILADDEGEDVEDITIGDILEHAAREAIVARTQGKLPGTGDPS